MTSYKNQVSVADLRQSLGDVLNTAHYTDGIVHVGKREQPHAAIISNGLADMIEFIRDGERESATVDEYLAKRSPDELQTLDVGLSRLQERISQRLAVPSNDPSTFVGRFGGRTDFQIE